MLRVLGVHHRAVRDIMSDDRSRTAGDTVPIDRRDEQIAGADMHIGTNMGVVLVHTIVVGGDGAAADVRVFAEIGIAHIAQMGHLGAIADVRLLHLDESTRL